MVDKKGQRGYRKRSLILRLGLLLNGILREKFRSNSWDHPFLFPVKLKLPGQRLPFTYQQGY